MNEAGINQNILETTMAAAVAAATLPLTTGGGTHVASKRISGASLSPVRQATSDDDGMISIIL